MAWTELTRRQHAREGDRYASDFTDAILYVATTGCQWRMLRHVFVDGGYAGPKLRDTLKAIERWTVQIDKRSDTAQGFEVLPRLGGRANLRMAGALPPPVKRLG